MGQTTTLEMAQNNAASQISEVLIKVFEHLPTSDLLSATLVSHYWNDAATDVLWSTKEICCESLTNLLLKNVSISLFGRSGVESSRSQSLQHPGLCQDDVPADLAA